MKKYRVIYVIADRNRHNLLVPKDVIDKVYILSSPEASLFNEYRHKYPDFNVVIIK